MVDVARCESQFRQYDKGGSVLRGTVNPDDYGIFQINAYYHLETSVKMGHNITSIEGNIAYARYLYDKNGLNDWIASKPCWSVPSKGL